jgi:D-hydroxyproline dehydrogenase subunit beta
MASPLAFDCAVVGSGIVGLAHAFVAARQGMKVAVIEREERAVGASIRNFGFVTVTGQGEGLTWARAKRSREVWAEVAPKAGIAVEHRGLIMCAHRTAAFAVLEDFAASAMGEGCRLLTGREAVARGGGAIRDGLAGALESPHELRVESRIAIPKLRAWLEKEHGVAFLERRAVSAIRNGGVETVAGPVEAGTIVVCPGADLLSLYPEVFARRGVTLCKLHMLRVADPGWRLPAAIMSDLGLVRYLGYAVSPRLPAEIEREQPEALANGVHLIAVQSADGSLVVGDSHHYGLTHDPFQPESVDALMLAELRRTLALDEPRVIDRWIGYYPSGPDAAFCEAVAPNVRLVSVTSGTGASTAFALAEETFANLAGRAPPPHVPHEGKSP